MKGEIFHKDTRDGGVKDKNEGEMKSRREGIKDHYRQSGGLMMGRKDGGGGREEGRDKGRGAICSISKEGRWGSKRTKRRNITRL